MLISDTWLSISRILLAILPKIKGITIKNENRAALLLSIPKITPKAMVAPLRDIPVK